MARVRSPGYPNFSLDEAVKRTRKIFNAERQNPVHRDVAAQLIGYTRPSGASNKALATLAHFDLVEPAGKGELRVTDLAKDILVPDPDDAECRKNALRQAALSPTVFQDLADRYPPGTKLVRESLEGYLVRKEYQDRAINPIITAYTETCSLLEQEKASESRGEVEKDDEESTPLDRIPRDTGELSGAKVGDYIQWESNGVLQFETPQRVRWISDDGKYLAVDGSKAGISMSEVSVMTPPPPSEASSKPPLVPPEFAKPRREGASFKVMQIGNKINVEAHDMGAEALGRLVLKLKKYKEILEMDGEEGAEFNGES